VLISVALAAFFSCWLFVGLLWAWFAVSLIFLVGLSAFYLGIRAGTETPIDTNLTGLPSSTIFLYEAPNASKPEVDSSDPEELILSAEVDEQRPWLYTGNLEGMFGKKKTKRLA